MSTELHEAPILVVDPGMHSGMIRRVSADRERRWAVTGADDKTVRFWQIEDGSLARTIRVPSGRGNVGKVYAVAMTPDGSLIAVGGWTRWLEEGAAEQIYLIGRTDEEMLRIEHLPARTLHLAFSRDGERLAAVFRGGGLRVFARDRGWAEAARDEHCPDQCYGCDFAADGRLATTCYDGKLRIYAARIAGAADPVVIAPAPSGKWPYGIAFSPDGSRLAVGYHDVPNVDVLGAGNLESLARQSPRGNEKSFFFSVAWSDDGRTLFAAGRCPGFDPRRILAWDDGGLGTRRDLPIEPGTVSGLVPLPDGDLVIAGADPSIARIGLDGVQRWAHASSASAWRNQHESMAVSSDGKRIEFQFEVSGPSSARFDLAKRRLILEPPPDEQMALPRLEGLAVENWKNSFHPALNGKLLPLQVYEYSRVLAIHPAGDRFVLGTEWFLRGYDAEGTPVWSHPSPGTVWGINISGDGRLVLAAVGDGTIRWHRMTDGAELLAFMPLSDRTSWVAWTPEGFYAATAGAHGILRWHVNRGWDRTADSVPVEGIPGAYRPEVLPLVLQELETPRALGLAVLAEYNRQVMLRTNSQVRPGARLHLLTIGISAYNDSYAKHLRLHYAHRDAKDLASALASTQEGLYSVRPQMLLDQDATKAGILRALALVRDGMAKGGGADLAVIHFSGHGAMLDGRLWLLPTEVDVRDAAGIKASALAADELRDELQGIAQHGRVLVLLDACHSGAATAASGRLAMDSTALRVGLAAGNVTVLTSSSGAEESLERPEWEHGAFTKVLLEALDDPDADLDRNRLITALGLTKYVANRVPALTGGAQNPGMEIRFEGTLFANAA